MKKYELISHTADVRIKATADTLKELFEISAEALCKIIQPDFEYSDQEEFTQKHYFGIESLDISALLIDFLAEQLSLMHTYNVLLPVVKIEHININRVRGFFSGIKVDSFDEDVKAVTYHEAEIKENSDGQLETMIVLDI
jgi:SHS2 domain-containing protein